MLRSTLLPTLFLVANSLALTISCSDVLKDEPKSDDEKAAVDTDAGKATIQQPGNCADALVQESYPPTYVFLDCTADQDASDTLKLGLSEEPDMSTIRVYIDGTALASEDFTATYDNDAKAIIVKSSKFATAKKITVQVSGKVTNNVDPEEGEEQYGYLELIDGQIHIYSGSEVYKPSNSSDFPNAASLHQKIVAFKLVKPCGSTLTLTCDHEPTLLSLKSLSELSNIIDKIDPAQCKPAHDAYSELVTSDKVPLACETDADCTILPKPRTPCAFSGDPNYPVSKKDTLAFDEIIRHIWGYNALMTVHCRLGPNETVECAASPQSENAVCNASTKKCEMEPIEQY